MSYKLSMILSLLFVVAFLLLGGDMICLSAAYSELDSTSITIGYLIAKSGRVDDDFISTLEEKYLVTFESISPSNPVVGEVVDFVIYREYDPLIMASSSIYIKAQRTTVVGYYG